MIFLCITIPIIATRRIIALFVTVKEKLLKEDLDAAIAMTEEILFHTKYDVVESMKKS